MLCRIVPDDFGWLPKDFTTSFQHDFEEFALWIEEKPARAANSSYASRVAGRVLLCAHQGGNPFDCTSDT